MEKTKITGWQFFLLTFIFVLGTSFFFLPGGLIASAKQDAWMIPLWDGAIGLVMACFWIALSLNYPGLSIIQISVKAAGTFIGSIIALLYIFFFIHLSSLVVRNVGDFMKATLMHRTPISVFHIMFLIVVCYVTIKGAKTIARVNEMLVPLIMVTFVIIFLFMLPEWSNDRLQPMFRLDVWKTAKETRHIIAFPFIDAVALFMMFPYVKNRLKTGFIGGIALASVVLSGITLYIVGVLGIARASHDTYPVFVITQEIRIGPMIEHLESTVTVILLITIFIKLSVSYYGAVLGICQLFRFEDRTWISIPLILLVSGIALQNENIVENIEWNKKYAFEFEFMYGILFPLLLLGLTWLKVGRGERREKS